MVDSLSSKKVRQKFCERLRSNSTRKIKSERTQISSRKKKWRNRTWNLLRNNEWWYHERNLKSLYKSCSMFFNHFFSFLLHGSTFYFRHHSHRLSFCCNIWIHDGWWWWGEHNTIIAIVVMLSVRCIEKKLEKSKSVADASMHVCKCDCSICESNIAHLNILLLCSLKLLIW